MFGWAISLGILIAAWKAGSFEAAEMMVAGLFAIAGSIGIGLDKIARK